MASSADWRARVYQELRRQKPKLVVVTFEDGEQKAFKPAGPDRGRWKRVLETLPAEWTRVELQDADESVLWGMDAPGASNVAAPMMVGKGGAVDQVTALMKVMLAAQDTVLARQRESIAGVQAAYEMLTETLCKRLTALEDLASTMLQSVYEMTLTTAEAQAALSTGAGDGARAGAEGMFAKLLQAKGIIPAGARAPTRKPNGHHPKAPTPQAPATQG